MFEELVPNDYVLIIKKNGTAFQGTVMKSRAEDYLTVRIGDLELFNFPKEHIAAFHIIDSDDVGKIDLHYGFSHLTSSHIRNKADMIVVKPVEQYYVREGKLLGRVLIGCDWHRVLFEGVNDAGVWVWKNI